MDPRIYKAQNFELRRWWETATKGLCDEAKARIAAEVEAHYADAVEEELGKNRTLGQARGMALAALGDPKSARKDFRRTYLTNQEVREWDHLNKSLSLKWPDRLFKFTLFLCGLALTDHILLWCSYGEGEGGIWPLARGLSRTAFPWGTVSLLLADSYLVYRYIRRGRMSFPPLFYLLNLAVVTFALTLAVLVICAGETARTRIADDLIIDVCTAVGIAAALGGQFMILVARLRLFRKLGHQSGQYG